MKKVITAYCKQLKSGKISFQVLEAKLNGEWYKVKFTRASGIDANKSPLGYVKVVFDSEKASIGTQEYEKKDGTKGTQKVLWIKDSDTTFTKTERTQEKQEEFDKLFDAIGDDLPF